jgi:hypothetical protein
MPRTENTPSSTTPIQKFSGLVLEVGETALPVGAMVVQENIKCSERGVLTTRHGLQIVRFEDD